MGFINKPDYKRSTPADVFGHIPGVPVGSTFENRLFLHHTSVHSGIVAGIFGSKEKGCYSVVMSGGYEDDKDEGVEFTYTGCGGRDTKDGDKPRDGPQTCDQTWENSRNASLRTSARTKKPVRVVRGFKSTSVYAPWKGYRYDGLYIVEEAWMDTGKSGFKVCKFRFSRLPRQPPIPRRRGNVPVDLSEWDSPKHFGASDDASESDSKDQHAKMRVNATASRPVIRKPKPSVSPIPLASNAVPLRPHRPINQVVPAPAPAAAVMNMNALLAEWATPYAAARSATPPTPSTSSSHASSTAVRRPRSSDPPMCLPDGKRMKVE